MHIHVFVSVYVIFSVARIAE